MQEGKTALIKKDGALPLYLISRLQKQALVDDPDAFMLAITKIIRNKHAHPVVAQMLHPDVESHTVSNAISISTIHRYCRQRGIPTAEG